LIKKKRRIIINGRSIPHHCRKKSTDLKWNEMNVDVVAECLGILQLLKVLEHIKGGGAKKSYYFCSIRYTNVCNGSKS
jgi:glyceraldehyde 3-phosphate dehydrogenase